MVSLRGLRERLGMTQKQAAAHLNMSQAHLSHFETGKTVLTQAQAQRFGMPEFFGHDFLDRPKFDRRTTVGLAVKRIRERNGMSFKEVGDLVGVHWNAVPKMEAGRRTVANRRIKMFEEFIAKYS